MNRIGASAAATALAQKLERLSNLHWTLVFLLQNPQWQGRGIVVEKSERYTMVILPDIALETKLHSSKNLPLNQEIMLRVTHIDLPGLTAHFAVI
jgi:exoribonuclease-2